MLAAWRARDAAYDGLFYFGVRTTRIVCRPSCPSQPRAENLVFFNDYQGALAEGFRPCKRCRPDHFTGTVPEWARGLIDRVQSAPEFPLRERDLVAMNLEPATVRRWFQKNLGVSFARWQRGLRLSAAIGELTQGEKIEDAMLSSGYRSISGLKEALKIKGHTHGEVAELFLHLFSTEIGQILAGATRDALCFLQFIDRQSLPRQYASLRKQFSAEPVFQRTDILSHTEREIIGYLHRDLVRFTVPTRLSGSDFQKSVWAALEKIPHGQTRTYLEVATSIGKPDAVRAVATAIGSNPINLIIPCHRVIGQDGKLTGYSGGLARKEKLLRLEGAIIA